MLFKLKEVKVRGVTTDGISLPIERVEKKEEEMLVHVRVGEKERIIPVVVDLSALEQRYQQEFLRKRGEIRKGEEFARWKWLTVELEEGKVEVNLELIFEAQEDVFETQDPPTKRWRGWTFMSDQEGKTVAVTDSWEVRLPVPFEKIGTEEELEYLLKNKVFFFDLDGDSAYSRSFIDYWRGRIKYLAEKLDRKVVVPPRPEELRKYKFKKVETLSGQTVPARVEEGKVIIFVLGEKVAIEVPAELKWGDEMDISTRFQFARGVGLLSVTRTTLLGRLRIIYEICED